MWLSKFNSCGYVRYGDALWGFGDQSMMGIAGVNALEGQNNTLGRISFISHEQYQDGDDSVVRIRSVQGSSNANFFLDEAGNVWWAGVRQTPSKIDFNHSIIETIAVGGNHLLALDSNGCVWGSGENKCGQLGLGDRLDRSEPCLLPDMNHCLLACGRYHSFILDSMGRLWSFGSNVLFQLGLGMDTKFVEVPTEVDLDNLTNSVIQTIASGENHNVILDIDGNIWVAGDNLSRQLGFPDAEPRTKFERLPGLPPIVSISQGLNHTLCLDESQQLWMFGSMELHARSIIRTPTKIRHDQPIQSCSAGRSASLFMDEPFLSILGFGRNDLHQLGNESVEGWIETPIPSSLLDGVLVEYYEPKPVKRIKQAI